MARRARDSGRRRASEDSEVDRYLDADSDADAGDPELTDEPDSDDDAELDAALDSGDDRDQPDLGERDHGPFDATELDLEQTDAVGRLDFGTVRVPMPDEAKLQVESAPGGRLKAVHILVPLGRLSISGLAAPRSEPLWPGLADEIVATLKRDGAWVRWELGPWGREVVAGTTTAQCRFIGVDGPRWMLYGVATGPADGVEELTDVLRDMIRGTIVVRDEQPYPVRTVLPLTAPPHLSAQLERLQSEESEAAAEPSSSAPTPQPPAPSHPSAATRSARPLRPAQPARPLDEPPRRLRPPRQEPAVRPVPPAQPAWAEPGWQPEPLEPLDSGRHAGHRPGRRERSIPDARRAEHSNPGSRSPLPLQPPADSPWAAAQPPSQPPRRPPSRRRSGGERGVSTPPSWRAVGDARNEPDPLRDPLPELRDEPGHEPASAWLADDPLYWTPPDSDRPAGRHRLSD